MAFRKLPPDVARELLRHVKPASSSFKNNRVAGNGNGKSNSNSSGKVLAACLGLLGFSASLPYAATKWIGHLTDRDEPLTHAQVRRGAFLNSGTRDVGRAPNWDWKNGRYNYPKDYLEQIQNQKPNDVDLGPDMAAVLEKDRRDQQLEKQLEDRKK